MVDDETRQQVISHVGDALSKGAKLACGRKVPEGFERSFFFEPTVLIDVNTR